MKIFNIRDYGAKTCDRLQTEHIQKAIDDCFLAGGIALKDQGKFIFWDLKDPTKPPVEGDETLKKKLANISAG